MRTILQRTVLVAAALGAALLPAAPAWAPHIAQVNLAPDVVQPGGEILVSAIRGFGPSQPVMIRLDSIDGPVLAEAETTAEFFAALPPVAVTIPANTSVGRHVLVVTQEITDEEHNIRGVPARAAFTVIDPSSNSPVAPIPLAAPVEVDGRGPGLETLDSADDGDSLLGPILAGVGVFGTAMFLAAASILSAASRKDA